MAPCLVLASLVTLRPSQSQAVDLQCSDVGTLLCGITPDVAVPARGAHRDSSAGSAGVEDLPCAIGMADTKRTRHDDALGGL